MEKEVRRLLWGAAIIGCLFGVGIGIVAGDPGMVKGVLAAAVGSLVAAPFVARLWRSPMD